MAREYNYIYKQLVEDDTDIVGHIAYSLYKADKIRFINKFKEENNREPRESEIKPFHDTSCLEGSLNGYKSLAVDVLTSCLDRTLAESVQQAENKCLECYKENIREVIQPILPPSKHRQFWNGVWQSVLGAFFFALILAAMAFVFQYKGTDFPKNSDKSEPGMEQCIPQDKDSIQCTTSVAINGKMGK